VSIFFRFFFDGPIVSAASDGLTNPASTADGDHRSPLFHCDLTSWALPAPVARIPTFFVSPAI